MALNFKHAQACIVPAEPTLDRLVPLQLYIVDGGYRIVPSHWDYGFNPMFWVDPHKYAGSVFGLK